MSEFFFRSKLDCTVPREGMTRKERAECLKNRLWFVVARRITFVGLGTYIAVSSVVCDRKPSLPPRGDVPQNVSSEVPLPMLSPCDDSPVTVVE